MRKKPEAMKDKVDELWDEMMFFFSYKHSHWGIGLNLIWEQIFFSLNHHIKEFGRFFIIHF